MKKVARILLLSTIVLAAAIITITACGGNAPAGSGGGNTLRAFIFNSNPVGFHVTSGFGNTRASAHNAFVVNAATSTPGGGNFAGFCNATDPVSARAATSIYGLGIWTSGDCAASSDDVGVSIPQDGQIGNISIDAVGTGTIADDGKVGLLGTASGQGEITVIHADNTRTITPIACTLGLSNNAKVHCDDKAQTAHRTNVVAGDQVFARFWYNPGDSYHAIRVNIEFATPTF